MPYLWGNSLFPPFCPTPTSSVPAALSGCMALSGPECVALSGCFCPTPTSIVPAALSGCVCMRVCVYINIVGIFVYLGYICKMIQSSLVLPMAMTGYDWREHTHDIYEQHAGSYSDVRESLPTAKVWPPLFTYKLRLDEWHTHTRKRLSEQFPGHFVGIRHHRYTRHNGNIYNIQKQKCVL